MDQLVDKWHLCLWVSGPWYRELSETAYDLKTH